LLLKANKGRRFISELRIESFPPRFGCTGKMGRCQGTPKFEAGYNTFNRPGRYHFSSNNYYGSCRFPRYRFQTCECRGNGSSAGTIAGFMG